MAGSFTQIFFTFLEVIEITFTRNPFRMMRDSMFSLKGNARTLVFSEPIFSIPYNMFAGYMTLFMLETGVSKSQVGMITSLGMALNILFALSSAYLTDRFGRRYTTFFFDIMGWALPQLIWALAGNIYFFIAGAIIGAFGRVSMNSYTCLMLEDSTPKMRVHALNFMQIASILAGFFAPVGGLLISRLTLAPAMRIMLGVSFVTAFPLFFIRNLFLSETLVGRQKMQEMKKVHLWAVMKGYLPVLLRMVKNRLLLIVLLMRTFYFIQMTLRGTFLSVLITERLGFPAETMAVFQTLNAIVMLLILIFITPILSQFMKHWPITLGIWFHVAATAALLLSPLGQNYPVLIISAVLLALGSSIASPRIEALAANTITNEDRSVINGLDLVILMLISTPFGFIGGVLAEMDVRLPILLTLVIFLLCLLLLRAVAFEEKRRERMNSGEERIATPLLDQAVSAELPK